LASGRVLEPVVQPFGVGHRHDRVEPRVLLDILATKKVCATGAGSARPVVSTMMASNCFALHQASRMRTRSPRTVQQTQAIVHLENFFVPPMIRSLSMPISPNSLR